MTSPSKVVGSQEITAFGFYDGATEGLASSIKQYAKCYFKLVAWDRNQDMRLYAINQIDEIKYNRLLTLLARAQEKPSTPLWLPKWEFYGENDKQEANGIVECFQIALCQSEFLALGDDIRDDSLKLIQVNIQTMDKINRVLKLDKPDDLSDWMLVL